MEQRSGVILYPSQWLGRFAPKALEKTCSVAQLLRFSIKYYILYYRTIYLFFSFNYFLFQSFLLFSILFLFFSFLFLYFTFLFLYFLIYLICFYIYLIYTIYINLLYYHLSSWEIWLLFSLYTRKRAGGDTRTTFSLTSLLQYRSVLIVVQCLRIIILSLMIEFRIGERRYRNWLIYRI